MAIIPGVGASSMHGSVVPIAYQTIAAGTSSVTFNNIPSTYQDLFVVISAYNSATYTGTGIWPRFNSDSGTNYSNTTLRGNGSTADSFRNTNATQITLDTFIPSNIPATLNIHVLNYANTSTYKTALFRIAGDANGSGYTELAVGLWRSTAAINSFQFIVPGGNSTLAGGSVSLYGVRTVGQ